MKRVTMYCVAIGFVAALAATHPVNAQERWPPGNCIDLANPGRCTEVELEQRKFDLMDRRIKLMERSIASCMRYMDQGFANEARQCWRHHRELFPPSR